MNIRRQLEQRIAAAVRAASGLGDAPALVTPSARPELGDYQANGVMAAAKQLKANPRKLAEQVVSALAPGHPYDLSDLAEKVDLAGPGFINIRLKSRWLAGQVQAAMASQRLGVDPPAATQTVVVDYSAPNLAKEMHVGHLRSTIIGDALVRTLEFMGQDVRRQNHVGDWGTGFGIVLLGVWHICMAERRHDPNYITSQLERLKGVKREEPPSVRRNALDPIRCRQQDDLNADWDGTKFFGPFVKKTVQEQTLRLSQLEEAYRFVQKVEELAEGTDLTLDSPPSHQTIALARVSGHVTSRFLQQPDVSANMQELDAWKYARELTLDACQQLYHRLSVLLTPHDVRGESWYAGMEVGENWSYSRERNRLPLLVAELQAQDLLRESEGAQCVFLDDFKTKDGSPLPLIVQKSDEGYLYATTDLAAIRFRVGELRADRVLYVVDARQSLHFRQVFAVAAKAGFDVKPGPTDGHARLEHVAFGTIMGPDGRPFKTREGGTVKLIELLEEAQKRALDVVLQKSPELAGTAQAETIARIVGIGAVKYADLAQNRTSDYVFSFDKMLALDGNTAPYMQYAYARVRSIFRKAGGKLRPGALSPAEPAERALALKLAQFPEAVDAVAQECLPNLLCSYLYELATLFSGFYESCPVIQSAEPIRASRLTLCDATARTIKTGLGLLGIDVVEQM